MKRSTASTVIKEVYKVIWNCLVEKAIPKPGFEQKLGIAKGFEKNVKFLNYHL